MLNAYVVGSEQVARSFRTMPDIILGRIEAVTEKFCLDLSARVKARKLTGQVLNVRTGRLRRSIHHELTRTSTKVQGAVGTNVEYARIHEYGGTFQVPPHNRLITQAWGKDLGFPVWQSVRGHSRRVPARSFLRVAYSEMRADYRRRIDAALRQLGRV